MSERLRLLAERVARELASRDWVPSVRTGEQEASSDAAARDGLAARGAPPEKQRISSTTAPDHPSNATPIFSAPTPVATTAPPPGVRFAREAARMADFIDHTLLKAEATRADIDALCDEALEHGFAAVCVNPVWVTHCAHRLRDSAVGVATVIGFPLGASHSAVKRVEAAQAVRDGATELDMVAAIGHIKCGDWHHVAEDIAAVVDGASGHLVKVIIESAALTPVEIIKASALAKERGANYVKTSTGFHAAGGATSEAVALMRLVVGDALGVKASGGVRDCATALRMIANGATRIGTSSGVAMAKCLGTGPLPLRDLLSLAATHADACACGACVSAEAPPGGSKPY